MKNHLEIVNMSRKSDYNDWQDEAIRFFEADDGSFGIIEILTFRSDGPVGTRSSFSFYREQMEEQGLVQFVERVHKCPMCEKVIDEEELEALGVCEECCAS
jgi:hypothetical protein